MSALDRVLGAAGVSLSAPPEEFAQDPAVEFALAAQMLGDAWVVLASDDDGDEDGDDASEDEDSDADHTGHALFKKLKDRMPDKAAAKMCAKADAKKKVAASMVSRALVLMGAVELSVTQAEREKAKVAGNSVGDAYPINNVKQLHSAAVLAASHHGNWQDAQTLIRRRAKELGVDVTTLPGFGDSSGDSGKMAASMVALAMAAGEPSMSTDHSGVMSHGPFHGSHTHPHAVMAAHGHAHFHNGDNSHESHHPGVPGRRW
jgi:hypothetical protein